MNTYYIHFINNNYSMKGDHQFYEYDTNLESDKMNDFLANVKESVKNDVLTISFETDELVTDAFVEVNIDTHRELALGEKPITFELSNFENSDITTIYIDLDNTIFKYSEMKNAMLEQCPQMLFPQANFGFFSNLEPFDNAIITIKKLMSNPRFEVMFATAPSVKNPMSYAEKRVSIEKHFGLEACEDLIIISKKYKLDDYNVFLIDDMKDSHGQDRFVKGTHLLYGGDEYPDWDSIDEFFFG